MITVFLQCLWDMKIPFWAMFSIFENMIMRHARDVIFPKFLTEFFQLALHTIVVEMIVTLVDIRRKLYSSAINSSNSSHSCQERKLSRLTFKFWIVFDALAHQQTSVKELMLKTSPIQTLYGGQFTLSAQRIKPKFFFVFFFILGSEAVTVHELDWQKKGLPSGKEMNLVIMLILNRVAKKP